MTRNRWSTRESQEIDLTAALQQLGIKSIFDADKVDFSVSHEDICDFALMTLFSQFWADNQRK